MGLTEVGFRKLWRDGGKLEEHFLGCSGEHIKQCKQAKRWAGWEAPAPGPVPSGAEGPRGVASGADRVEVEREGRGFEAPRRHEGVRAGDGPGLGGPPRPWACPPAADLTPHLVVKHRLGVASFVIALHRQPGELHRVPLQRRRVHVLLSGPPRRLLGPARPSGLSALGHAHRSHCAGAVGSSSWFLLETGGGAVRNAPPLRPVIAWPRPLD